MCHLKFAVTTNSTAVNTCTPLVNTSAHFCQTDVEFGGQVGVGRPRQVVFPRVVVASVSSSSEWAFQPLHVLAHT